MHELVNFLRIFANHLDGPYSYGLSCLFFLSISFSIFFYLRPSQKVESHLFWVLGLILIGFTALRPMGIARDDAAYVWWSSRVSPVLESASIIQSSRDWAWYLLVSIFKTFLSSDRAVLTISAAGTFVQLFIITRLCSHKLLAFTLFLPLIYIYYDFTLLRGGLALTVYFLGLYFLCRSRKIIGSSILIGNYFFHSQGIFSIGVIPFFWIARNKYVVIAIYFTLITFIYLAITPSFEQLSFLSRHESIHYWNQYQSGYFDNERVFPLTSLVTIGYVVFLLIFSKSYLKNTLTEQYALASICFGFFLAWFFSPIHILQTRLFDFFLAPLVFLIGNLSLTRTNLIFTLGISIFLYIRMDLIHNWIIG